MLLALGQNITQAKAGDSAFGALTRELAAKTAGRTPVAGQLPLLGNQIARQTGSLWSNEAIKPEWSAQFVANIGRFENPGRLEGWRQGTRHRAVERRRPTENTGTSQRSLQTMVFPDEGNHGPQFGHARQCTPSTWPSHVIPKTCSKNHRAWPSVEEGITAYVFLGLSVLEAIALLGALYLLVRVFNQEAIRRHMQSENENRRNQDAILRLLNDMADLADGDLTIRAAVTEDLTGAIADSINFTIDELAR